MKKTLLMFMLAAAHQSVMAGFEMEPDVVATTSIVTTPSVEKGTLISKYEAVTFSGTPDGEIARLDGFVTKVKLVDALQQISPKGWHAFVRNDPAKRFDKSRIVSWDGGRPWVDVLDTLAKDQGFTAVVDWGTRSLHISMNAQAPIERSQAENSTPIKRDNCWDVRYSDGRLSNAVARWATDASWQLSWEMKDIPAAFEGSFCGQFEQAVDNLVTAINKSGIPMRYEGKSGNKVLRIFSGAQ